MEVGMENSTGNMSNIINIFSGLDPMTLQDLYKVGYCSVNRIIVDTCEAIADVIGSEYMRVSELHISSSVLGCF